MNVLIPFILTILPDLPQRFDSHRLIERLRQSRWCFAEMCAAGVPFAEHLDPTREFNRQFALWFGRTFADRVQRGERVYSANIGGRITINREWIQGA